MTATYAERAACVGYEAWADAVIALDAARAAYAAGQREKRAATVAAIRALLVEAGNDLAKEEEAPTQLRRSPAKGK